MSGKGKGKKRKKSVNMTVQHSDVLGDESELTWCKDECVDEWERESPSLIDHSNKKWRAGRAADRWKQSPCPNSSHGEVRVSQSADLDDMVQQRQEATCGLCGDGDSEVSLAGPSSLLTDVVTDSTSPLESYGSSSFLCSSVIDNFSWHVKKQEDMPGPSGVHGRTVAQTPTDRVVEVIDVLSESDVSARNSPEVVVIGSTSPRLQSLTQQIGQDEELARRLQTEFDRESDITVDANSRDENVTWTDETYSDFLAQPHLEDEEEQSDTEEDGSYHMCWRRHPTMFQTRKRRRHSPLNVRFALGFEFLAPLALLRSRSVEGDRQSRSYEDLLRLIDQLGPGGPTGLTRKEIDRLPRKKFTTEDVTSSPDQLKCVVCLSDFEKGQYLRVLPCTHRYHKTCVDKWLKTNRTCPICRLTAALE